MSQPQITPQEKPKSKELFLSYVRNILATIFWLYVILKLFIFDLDTYLIKDYFPGAQWIINFKFFLFLGVITLFWVFTKNINVLGWFLFIIFYPIIILFYKIPVLIFKTKSWAIAIAFVNTIISFFSSLKYNFFIFSLSAISFCLLFSLDAPQVIYTLIIVLLIILVVIYIHRFLTIFMSSSLYKIQVKGVNFLIKNTEQLSTMDEEIRNLPVTQMNQVQLQKWTNNLQFAIILNRGCFFLSSKLQEYQKSNLNIIFYLLNLFILFFITIFFLGGINYALFKLDHSAFTVTANPNFFDFIYYSFNTIFLSSIPEIIASNWTSHSLRMVEIIFSFLLISIFTVLIFNIKSKKHQDELDNIINELKTQGEKIESRVRSEFK